MKKIVSNVLVVSSQLMIGGLFLFMLFSGHPEDNKLVVIENNNLNKMADAVSELFEIDQTVTAVADEQREEELRSAEQKAREEEEARKAQEEAARKAAEEEAKRLEAERIAQEEAARKAQEEAARNANPTGSQTVEALQNYAHDLVINSYGWTEDDFVALVNLWNKESGWNLNCYNSYSGAYGIPQSLPGSKMASEGDDWQTNGETQIRWGLKYIQGRYGSPSGAWGHFLSHNWY